MSESPYVEIRIEVPRKIYELLEKIEKEEGVPKEDIISRALVRIIDEYLEKGG